MRTNRPLHAVRRCRLLALLLVAAPLAAGEWYEHYDNGQRALSAGDWRTAVVELGKAIERRGDSGLRLRTDGTLLVNYFPYLGLGVAYTELGEHAAALRAFDTEDELGLIDGVPAARAELDQARARAIAARDRAAADARTLAARRGEILRRSLAEARALRDGGLYDEGMRALASGLAVSPQDTEATALMEELRTAATRGDRAAATLPTPPSPQIELRPPTISGPLATEAATDVARSTFDLELARRLSAAESDLAEGRSEAALAIANRVLAADRGNAAALDIVRRAYAELSRRLLGSPQASGEAMPPTIRFANSRATFGGEFVEHVAEADFVLSGVAIGRSPITVEAFLGSAGSAADAPAISQSSQTVGDTFITEFRLPRRLPAGRSTLVVVARDQRGLTARAEFVAWFKRPWYRSPAAAAGAVGFLALVVAALGWRRRQRRRVLVERGFNPYVAGGPVFDQALFYGREPLIQRVLQTVHNNSLMLHGERRIGKTSLLHQVRRRLEGLEDPDYRFHAVYVDLQGTREEHLFATLADQTFEGLQPVLASQSPMLGRVPALARDAYDHHDLVRELHTVLGALQAASPRAIRLVLLIDEVDELNHYDPRVNQKLRSLFMKGFAEQLVAVVAGVRIRKEWEREGSPWYNFFEEVAVEPIAADAARELVLAPIRGVFRVDRGVADEIVERCERRPFRIQKLCRALVNRLHETGRHTITLDDVAAVGGLE